MNTVNITNIQRFCMHDGEGIRTTVFFKGCPLHCKWCHNPETQKAEQEVILYEKKCIGCGKCVAACPNNAQVIGDKRIIDRQKCKTCGKCIEACNSNALELAQRKIDIIDLVDEIKRDLAFYGNGGGITVSGGEPTFQPEALIELLKYSKENGINTAIETCGAFSSELIPTLVKYTDTFLYDIKDTDSERLRQNTGADLSHIINNLKMIDSLGGKNVMRCIIIPDVNMNYEHAKKLCKIFSSLNKCSYIELLPYHPYATDKAKAIGIMNPVIYRTPEKAEIISFGQIIKNNGIPVKAYAEML